MTIETKILPIKLLKAKSSELYTMYDVRKYSTMAISILMRYNNCITDLRSQMLHKK